MFQIENHKNDFPRPLCMAFLSKRKPIREKEGNLDFSLKQLSVFQNFQLPTTPNVHYKKERSRYIVHINIISENKTC